MTERAPQRPIVKGVITLEGLQLAMGAAFALREEDGIAEVGLWALEMAEAIEDLAPGSQDEYRSTTTNE